MGNFPDRILDLDNNVCGVSISLSWLAEWDRTIADELGMLDPCMIYAAMQKSPPRDEKSAAVEALSFTSG